MNEAPFSPAVDRRVLIVIGLVLTGYGVAAAFHLPQRGTELIVAASRPGLVEEGRRRTGGSANVARHRRNPPAVLDGRAICVVAGGHCRAAACAGDQPLVA